MIWQSTIIRRVVNHNRTVRVGKCFVIARIHEAEKYIPLDRLCLSPQYGFASCEIGNKLTELEQSSSYSAYLEEGKSEPENPIVAYDNGNAVAVSDLDEIAEQAANSSVYPGTWSGSILDYFSGVMRQNPGKHYVAFRNSQYSYFLYYGDDLTFSDGVVSGSADYVEYNYNNNNYVVTRGNDNVNINISSGVVYTDLNSAYGALDGASEITLQTVLLVSVLVCLGFSLLCRIFFRR